MLREVVYRCLVDVLAAFSSFCEVGGLGRDAVDFMTRSSFFLLRFQTAPTTTHYGSLCILKQCTEADVVGCKTPAAVSESRLSRVRRHPKEHTQSIGEQVCVLQHVKLAAYIENKVSAGLNTKTTCSPIPELALLFRTSSSCRLPNLFGTTSSISQRTDALTLSGLQCFPSAFRNNRLL